MKLEKDALVYDMIFPRDISYQHTTIIMPYCIFNEEIFDFILKIKVKNWIFEQNTHSTLDNQ